MRAEGRFILSPAGVCTASGEDGCDEIDPDEGEAGAASTVDRRDGDGVVEGTRRKVGGLDGDLDRERRRDRMAEAAS